MKASRPPGRPARNPDDPIKRFVCFAASEHDIAVARCLAAMTGAPSLSAAIRTAVRSEYGRMVSNV